MVVLLGYGGTVVCTGGSGSGSSTSEGRKMYTLMVKIYYYIKMYS